MRKVFLFGVLIFIHWGVGAQSDENDIGVYRPKMAEFSIGGLMDYKTSSTSEDFGSAKNEVEREVLMKANVGIPILIKDGMIFGVMLKYYEQQFAFDLNGYPTGYDLYEHLDSRKFRSIGSRLFLKKDLGKNNALMLLGGAELKSDKFQWNDYTTKYFISGGVKHAVSKHEKIGGGLIISRTMGRMIAFPLFTYEKQFSPKWTVNLTLPKSVSVRRHLSNSNYLIAAAQVKGYQYNMTNSIEGGSHDLTLVKRDLQFTLSWEHEIHDWIWFGADVGYNKNLRYSVTNPGEPSRNAIIDLTSKDAPYLKLSLFLVPPKKLYNKVR